MRILAVSPVPDYATRDVWRGQCDGLEALGAEVLRMEYGNTWRLFADFREFAEVTGRVDIGKIDHFLMAGDRVVMSALVNEVDMVYFVAPMHTSPTTLKALKELSRQGNGPKTAAYFTECPYDDDWTLKFAELFDYCFVCDAASVERYRAANPNTWYVGHAYDPKVHQPERVKPDKDVVFVGTNFPSRVAFLEQVDWAGIDLNLYGLMHGLGASPLKPYVKQASGDIIAGSMTNDDAVKLYRQARIGLQMHRRDGFKPSEAARAKRHGRGLVGAKPMDGLVAHSLGPRSYELAACGVFQVSDDSRPELREVFGDAVPAYRTPDELGALLRRYLDEPALREVLRVRQREAVQPYTFERRMRTVLEAVG